tara:strand:- start:37 stop:2253 length:2217 start_codon:yes stop_codon:yes gene_type:complete
MVKYILGIQSYANHDSGASILKFGKNVKTEIIAISEERLLRKKYPYTFPILSILYCMNHFKIKRFNRIDLIVSDWIRKKRWLRSGPTYNYQEFDYIKEKLNFDKKKIIQIDHHLAHAASTYYTSEFNNSAILIVDGNGSDIETNSYFYGKKNNIEFISRYKNHGIGAAYGAVTKEILNLGTGGEGKTMGLAPYGNFDKRIKIPYSIKGIKTDFSNFMLRMPYSDLLNHINPNHRLDVIKNKITKANKLNITSKKYANWAYMIQDVAEKMMAMLGKDIFLKTKSKNICLAGGVALNSVANEILFKKNKFKDIFIFPACADAGIPYGLCLWAYHNIYKKQNRIKFQNAYTGKLYSQKHIKKLLNQYRIRFRKTNYKEIAKLISEGNVIGNFHGKSEYGPRALGNRSILADARKKEMRDHINKNIKHRETYRPFAPAILEDLSLKYFFIKKSPFMLRVTKCKKKKIIPSAIHVDGTARLQTVNKKQNLNFYSIIEEFYKVTGVPVILNTSFNDAGEPLVETPLDALISSFKTNLDYLVIENNLINIKQFSLRKKEKLLKKLNKNRDQKINNDTNTALDLITKNYSKNEMIKKIKKNNKLIKSLILTQPIKEFKNYINKIKSNEKVIIVGSNDHTNAFVKIFENELKKNKNNFDYYEINQNDIYKKKKKINFFKNQKKPYFSKYDKIIISSFQHSEHIKESLIEQKISNFFSPYNNSSRSILDIFFINKYKTKYKLHSKKIF